MTQHQANAVFGRLTTHGLVEARGPDAKDFFHRITTADLKNLKPGQVLAGALLQANGKLIAAFDLFEMAPDRFLLLAPFLETPLGAAAHLAESLEKLHFAEAIEIEPKGGQWHAWRILGQGEAGRACGQALKAALQAELAFEGNVLQEPGFFSVNKNLSALAANLNRWAKAPVLFDYLFLAEAKRSESVESLLERAGFRRQQSLEGFRIRAEDPAGPSELNTSVLPLEVGFGFAVHENKGCYPGQEVIERIRSMGKPPRKLVLLRGEGATPTPGTPAETLDPNAGKGVVTSASANPLEPGWVALALVRNLAKESGSS